MKRNLQLPELLAVLVLMLLLLFALSVSAGTLRTNITLAWDYPLPTSETTNFTFILYSHTNVTVPLTNWPVFATINGTNREVTLPLNPQVRFFVMTASNYWGISDFSNVAWTPPAPRSDVSLKLQ